MMKKRGAHMAVIALVIGAGTLGAGGANLAEGAASMTKQDEPRQGGAVRVLNNFVTELLAVSGPALRRDKVHRFRNPRDGWVFIAATAQVEGGGKVQVILKRGRAEQVVIEHQQGSAETLEAMRNLPAGEHGISIRCRGNAVAERLVVRAVPEIIYCKYAAQPHVSEYGAYDWEFLSRHILPHVNTIVGTGNEADRPRAEEWKRRGGRWIVECGLPGLSAESVTADEAYTYWAENPGYKDALLDGIIVDEFGSGWSVRDAAKYRAWTEAVNRLYQRPEWRGKLYYPYCGELWRCEPSRAFAEAVMGHGGRVAFERYLREQATEAEAEAYVNHALANETLMWRRVIPGSEKHLIICLGYMSAPPESLNCNPATDYKVYMDMQFNVIANHPDCAGIYGIMEYLSSYADEEIVRWTGKLYRHYCIDGRRERLTRDPYMLPHLRNPDFDEGTEGWTIAAAEGGSMQVRNFKGYGWLQGRYPPSAHGDNFLWSKRSAARPNVFSQTIRELKPGRLYSLKMYTGDYRDLVEGKSARQEHAVGIKIDGVEMIPEKCFRHVFANCYSHHLGPFDDKHKFWMNYHQRVFRAKSESAHLSISDWASEGEPGGPAGQELMYNFIEVQPYLAE